ncbi:hypothetical protein PENTCL1PPCAC_15124, partial [Pristionchus entomophagus]
HDILAHSEVAHYCNRCSAILAPTVTVRVDDTCIGRKREHLLDYLVIRSSHKILSFVHESLLDDVKVGDLHERN